MKSLQKYVFIVIVLLFNSCQAPFSSQVSLKKAIEPVYPQESIDKKEEGNVGLLLLVDKDGNVNNVEVQKSSGYEALDKSAVNYGYKLQFNPLRFKNPLEQCWIRWEVGFRANNGRGVNGGMGRFNVLVFHKTGEYKHESIDAGLDCLDEIADKYCFSIYQTDNSDEINDENLSSFDVVLFLNTSGNILDEKEKNALENYIKKGGGFVGIHGASATEDDWEWYGKLIGAHFDDHPVIQEATINVINKEHPSTKHLPQKWIWSDEWYNWKTELDKKAEVLLTVDESTYKGGKHKEFHPVAWCQEFEGSRSWYTSLGHSEACYSDSLYISHLAGGIIWAARMEELIEVK
ncbi:MAG: TonB family protein [Melioribacteraceae bacterium]|nr:TonB family protein [Melioribacteraceae bacterium]